MAKKPTVRKTFIAIHVINNSNLPTYIKGQTLELNGRLYDLQWYPWYAYDPDSGKILAFHIGKCNDSACKASMKNLAIYKRLAVAIDSYRTDDWKSYRES